MGVRGVFSVIEGVGLAQRHRDYFTINTLLMFVLG